MVARSQKTSNRPPVGVEGHGPGGLVESAATVSRTARRRGRAGWARSSAAACCGTGRSSMPWTASPVRAVEDVVHAGLAAVDDDLALPAVDQEVGEDRRHDAVVVPDVVVDRLEVPAPLAGLGVDGDEAVGEEVVAAAGGAVSARVGVAERPVDEAEFGVDGRVDPADRAAGLPGVALPGVVPELAGPRGAPEGPDDFAGRWRRGRNRGRARPRCCPGCRRRSGRPSGRPRRPVLRCCRRTGRWSGRSRGRHCCPRRASSARRPRRCFLSRA